MEQSQRKHIEKYLPQLIQDTRCSVDFISYFIAAGILGNADVSQLDAIANENEKTKQFYDIIITRSNAYSKCIQALEITKQTGAHKILKKLEKKSASISKCQQKVAKWRHLEFRSQTWILAKTVQFMGVSCQLGHIINRINTNLREGILQRTLVGDTLQKISDSSKDFILANDTIPDPIKYYVSRTISKRTCINPTVFQIAPRNDILVVEGISRSKLTKLAHGYNTDTSGNQRRNTSAYYILLEDPSDFYKICQLSSDKSVHWIKYEAEQFYWVKSHGSMSLIQNHVSKDQENISEDNIISHFLNQTDNNKPICISDSPGMGKTILLANIARQMRAKFPKKIILFLDFNELVQNLEPMKKILNLHTMIAYIIKNQAETVFGQEILFHLFTSLETKVELFLDGFDEIHQDQLEMAKFVLRCIMENWRNARLFVTTRPNMINELEETLEILGYNILPFQENDQTQFMQEYWANVCGAIKGKYLSAFANLCLTEIRDEMTDFESDIAGVPLQCLMLAQVNSEHAVKYSQQRGMINSYDDNHVKITSIYGMYKQLMKKLFERAVKREELFKKKSGFFKKLWSQLNGNKKNLTECIRHFHVHRALRLLFPDQTKHFEKFLNPFIRNICDEDVYSVGIIVPGTLNDTNPRFYHRTFAEYLIAEFVAENIGHSTKIGSREIFINFLFGKLLDVEPHKINPLHNSELPSIIGNNSLDSWKFTKSVICYFLDFHIEDREFGPANWLFFQSCLENTVHNNSTSFYRKSVSCAYQDFANIFQICQYAYLSVDTKKSKSKFDKLRIPASDTTHFLFWSIRRWTAQPNWDEILKIAAIFSSGKFFKLSRSLVKSIQDSNPVQSQTQKPMIGSYILRRANSVRVPENNGISPLHFAVKRGNYKIVEDILINDQEKIESASCLLHVCVSESQNNNINVINSKIQIVELLCDNYSKVLVEIEPENGRTPLLMNKIHLNLIKCLVEKEANVFATCREHQNTIAHTALRYLNQEDYIDLVTFLLDKGYSNLFNVSNKLGQTPTSLIRSNQKLLESLVEKICNVLGPKYLQQFGEIFSINIVDQSDLNVDISLHEVWV